MINLTVNAIEQIKEILLEEQGSKYVRAFIEGGGCSGMQYGFSIEDTIQEDDTMIEQHNIKMIVDSFSYPYVDGVTIDFEKKLFSSSFVIKNPNVKASCGCGSSFTV